MRGAADQIMKFNRGLHPYSLSVKLQRLSSSPFVFFRGTFHLFARDLLRGSYRKWPCLAERGQIIADLHTENFGTYRAITNEVVYDINDFDESTTGLYEFDIRRLTTSLVLSALDNQHALGDGAIAAELCAQAYLETLGRLAKFRTRAEFEELKSFREVRSLLGHAGEKSRAEMMKRITVDSGQGRFAIRGATNYLPVSDAERKQAAAALKGFQKTCFAPRGAHPERFTLQDVAFRIAGAGSLGRQRYALLLGLSEGKQSYETLRLVEFKAAYDSGLDALRPYQSKNRGREVLEASLGFQLCPKRYLGWTSWDGKPMQTREIGANDARFEAKEFVDPERFRRAARIFGELTARAHLLSTLGKSGPRGITKALVGGQDRRWAQRQAAFAVAYTDRVLDDFAEFLTRKQEVLEKLVPQKNLRTLNPATAQA